MDKTQSLQWYNDEQNNVVLITTKTYVLSFVTLASFLARLSKLSLRNQMIAA